MSHVIFNFHLGKDQSVLYQKKGVGHLFFINRPIHSPTHIGQSLISTLRFIQLPRPTLASWSLSYLACVDGGNSERVL